MGEKYANEISKAAQWELGKKPHFLGLVLLCQSDKPYCSLSSMLNVWGSNEIFTVVSKLIINVL